MKDVYFKDEGDFVTVIAQSEKALNVFAEQEMPSLYSEGHKFDVELSDIHRTLAFCISHSLSVDSEVPIKIPEKPRVPAYENEMCKAAGLKCTCNGCDRIIYEDENWVEKYTECGGYCKDCLKETLIDAVKDEMRKDLAHYDTTAIHQLLSVVPEKDLIEYLPEEISKQFNSLL